MDNEPLRDCFDRMNVGFEHYREGDFRRCQEILMPCLGPEGEVLPAVYLAEVYDTIASCIERAGRPDVAKGYFEKAESLAPGHFPHPTCMENHEFDALVRQAMSEIPMRFAVHLNNVKVLVKDYPGREAEDPFILGLYVGVPRTERDHYTPDHPDTIYIYKRTHELEFREPVIIRREIGKTLIHEIGHHFGLHDEEMGLYE